MANETTLEKTAEQEIAVKPRLKKLLKEHGLTQDELSELTGVAQSTISKFDHVKRHDTEHLLAISRTLGVRIEDLFEIEGSSPEK